MKLKKKLKYSEKYFNIIKIYIDYPPYIYKLLKMSSDNQQNEMRIPNIKNYNISVVNDDLILTTRDDTAAEFNPITYCPLDQDLVLTGDNRNVVPNYVKVYVCSNLHIIKIPNILHSNIEELYCSHTSITAFEDKLPEHLKVFVCNNSIVKELPSNLPSGLKVLCCESGMLKMLPDLPESLVRIHLKGAGLEENYPEIFKLGTAKEIVAYVNRRNCEMRCPSPPTLIDHITLLSLDLAYSTIKNWSIGISYLKDDKIEFGAISGNTAISYRRLLISVLHHLSLHDIVNSNVKVKLGDQKGELGYNWIPELSLSLCGKSATDTMKDIVNIILAKKWPMDITIALKDGRNVECNITH